MSIQTRQVGRMEQGLTLLPQMLQCIEVLRLTTAELLARIDQELESNETLVAENAPGSEASVPSEPSGERGEDSGGGSGEDSGAYTAEWDPDAGTMPAGPTEEDRKQAFLQNLPDRSTSLLDHIEAQLAWLDLEPRIRAGVEILAGHLDHRGLLTAPPVELRISLGAEFDACLEVLQSLEPHGLGARDPIEAMLLQLPANDPDFGDIEAILRQHLEPLARNKLPEVARALGRPVAEICGLIERIKRLDPHPGAAFGQAAEVEVAHPDVVVRLLGDQPDQIEVEVDGMGLPDLGVRAEYEDMARDGEVDRDVQRYLKEKLRSARELIGAVAQRQRTLARVTHAIMRHQFDFLLSGRRGVRSLGMEQIAAELGLHPSTVSRAIAGKFVQTDHGIYRLRDFFDGDRRTTTQDPDASGRMAIRDHIQALIAGEDPRHPLSDDDLVRHLLARKVKVARRTVAKYRKELGLASSWRRRNYA